MQEEIAKNLLTLVLESLYSIAHWMGGRIIDMVSYVFPQTEMLNEVVDPIGMLAILTILLLVAQVARKIAWIIVVSGWVLIILRVVLLVID